MTAARHHDKQLEEGIYIGNQVDKTNLGNPIARAMVRGFDRAFLAALAEAQPKGILEVGCGEGRLAVMMSERFGVEVLATDFSEAVIAGDAALANERLRFEQASIYGMTPERYRRDVVVCCEVLEHLERPAEGLDRLRNLGARSYVLSVPNEPIWRVLNFARGKYWKDWGNTPGHLNHWSRATFAALLAERGFRVDSWFSPFPWLMVRASVR